MYTCWVCYTLSHLVHHLWASIVTHELILTNNHRWFLSRQNEACNTCSSKVSFVWLGKQYRRRETSSLIRVSLTAFLLSLVKLFNIIITNSVFSKEKFTVCSHKKWRSEVQNDICYIWKNVVYYMDDKSCCLSIYEKHNSELGSYLTKVTFLQVDFSTCISRNKLGLHPEWIKKWQKLEVNKIHSVFQVTCKETYWLSECMLNEECLTINLRVSSFKFNE